MDPTPDHVHDALTGRPPAGEASGGEGDSRARAWALALLSVAVLLGMSPWFTASAAGEALQMRHGLGSGQLAWLTGVVQIGFVAGTLVAAVLNLADIVPARRYFAVSALLAGVANASLPLATGFEGLVVARFLTGFFLAGVYPPAMKMAATWFRARRGMAIGMIVGALTIGKAGPFLLRAGGGEAPGAVIVGASAAALAGGLLVLLFYRDGPHPFTRKPFRWDLVGTVLRHRETRLATYGYLGHMWELYAVWSAVGLFFQAFWLDRGHGVAASASLAALSAFVVIAIGGPACVAAGVLADRWGRERVAAGAMAVSGACALVAGWTIGLHPLVVLPLFLVWGAAVVADSAQFSSLVTEVAPSHAAGTALTLQTSLGFALTTVTIWAVPVVAGAIGWGWAFCLLVPGPLLGIRAMRRLARVRLGSAGTAV